MGPLQKADGSAEYVVVVGAGTGGLEALRTLLQSVSSSSRAAFVVVASSSEPHLVESLEPSLKLPVREAFDGTPLEPATVTVLPMAAQVAVIDTHLRLTAARMSARARVDTAFQAVAAEWRHRAVGVVVAGSGTDGTLGMRHIRRGSGLMIAQDPEEAAPAGGMPRSAIVSGLVDLVLPLREIPAAIESFCGTVPRLPNMHQWRHGESELGPPAELLDLVETRTGYAFGHLTRPFVAQRVSKRMRLHALVDWLQYLDVLRANAGEAEALARDLLEYVIEPMSERGTFARLEREVIPALFATKRDVAEPLRAWVVGCSTGEDAYLVAIAMLEQRARSAVRPRLKIFASDLAEEALQRARNGVYPAEIELSLSPERLDNYFVREDGTYRVRSQLRDLVLFARHDVVRDFPFSHLDLIVCRSDLLDSVRPKFREGLLRNFHYALQPEGRLVVGSTTTLDDEVPGLFLPVGEGGVYRRVGKRRAALLAPVASSQRQQLDTMAGVANPVLPEARVVHLALLEPYSPPSVLVDTDGRVIHYSNRAGRYLRLPGGEVTHDLLRLLREPLRSAVRAGLDAVGGTEQSWVSDALLVHTDAGIRRVAVHVEPARQIAAPNVRLIVFEEVAPGDMVRDDDRVQAAADITMRLESELEEARGRLQHMVGRAQDESGPPRLPEHGEADLENALDDLATAKRELRSINEELVSLDQDNRARLEELGRLSADLEVLLESTGLGTLFLDRDLKVVRFTPPLLDIFDVAPADKGRPLGQLKHSLRDDALLIDAKRVVEHLAEIEREVEAEDGRWYLLRMLPYRSAPQGIGGVAITLVDITSRKRAEEKLREADRRKDEFIALLAHELRNPLAPISSGIEILKRRDLDPSLAERITVTMSRQAAQLVRLIDDLLDVSRITSGRLQLRKQRVVLGDIVRDAVAAVRPLVERLGHDLVVDAPQAPIALEADSARLTQVVANLLNNSARYTGAGGRIEIGVRQEGGVAVVTVKDNGFGIPQSTLPHIFDMFYQGADARSATQAGLGIGLALAKSLVEMHGGTIAAASGGVDKGSLFTVCLPVLLSAGAEQAAGRPRSKLELGGHRVLVVDDNADAAKTLAVLIQTLGQNDVHVAFSGEEALPLAERVKPDTVFLDLKMPEMDGYEVAQRLRREPWCEDTWLVALTGWGLDEHKRRTKEAGFNEHLTKPADPAALEAILSRPPNGGAQGRNGGRAGHAH